MHNHLKTEIKNCSQYPRENTLLMNAVENNTLIRLHDCSWCLESSVVKLACLNCTCASVLYVLWIPSKHTCEAACSQEIFPISQYSQLPVSVAVLWWIVKVSWMYHALSRYGHRWDNVGVKKGGRGKCITYPTWSSMASQRRGCKISAGLVFLLMSWLAPDLSRALQLTGSCVESGIPAFPFTV